MLLIPKFICTEIGECSNLCDGQRNQTRRKRANSFEMDVEVREY